MWQHMCPSAIEGNTEGNTYLMQKTITSIGKHKLVECEVIEKNNYVQQKKTRELIK